MSRYSWLTSKNRKRHQREVNKLMRLMNQNIENDDLSSYGMSLGASSASLGYFSVDEFLDAVKSGKAIFKLAPDSFVLEFKIPSKIDKP